jgi:predicted ATP-dependent protease
MPITKLPAADLRIRVDPDALHFGDTSELLKHPLPWIGQQRAQVAARFGLEMDQKDYNLFVLGEIGSGRSSLLLQLTRAVAAGRAVPPDLCYLHNFDAPELPRAVRLPAGQGRLLRQSMLQLTKNIQARIPQRLNGLDFKTESERIRTLYKLQESQAYALLDAFAEARSFTLQRDVGRMVFTYRDDKGHVLREDELLTLPKQRRIQIEEAEQELRSEIANFIEKMQPQEKVMNDSLATLRRQTITPVMDLELQTIRSALKIESPEAGKLAAYLEQVERDVLDNLEAFQVIEEEDEEARLEALAQVLGRLRVNLVVDNHALSGAPVIVEDNALFRSLFGSIEYQSEDDVLVTDFSRIRAGSLHKAHGGFILLYMRDLLADELAWEKLRRFLRSGRLQIEEPGLALTPMAAVSLTPEAVEVTVKIVLIGSSEHYYALQELDPEFVRHFGAKVDFAESFLSTLETRHASAIFVAHTCDGLGLPHFSAAAVARLIEESHRHADDQLRQSAIFSNIEATVMESAVQCKRRVGGLVEIIDIQAALDARTMRHGYVEQRMQESITDGERLTMVVGDKVGQLNGLTQIDQGHYRFGFPVRVTAQTFAGDDGLLNIEREVEMSGPIHDKGVLVLHGYLSALFAHIAPLALNASLSFEQEYGGVEGDSASCAEFYALLSCLASLPLKQGIAVTGAINLHGEILPVGGINEKIEGYFRTCESAGLDGHQGVLIPRSNQRHLMLAHNVIEAVSKNLFQVYIADHVSEGIELLTGVPSGLTGKSGRYSRDTVLGRAQKTLQDYRIACQAAQDGQKPLRKRAHRG